MARRPSVRYFASKGGYYTEHKGHRHRLATGPDDFPAGPTYRAAMEAFKLILVEAEQPASQSHTLATLTPLFLDWLQHRRKSRTRELREKFLRVFVQHLGSVPVAKLTPLDVDRVTDLMRQPRAVNGKKGRKVMRWADSSVRLAMMSLQACLNWSVRQGVQPVNPLKLMEQPAARSRGHDCIVTPADHTLLLSQAGKSMRPVLVVLEACGARPGEILAAEARHWRPDLGAIVYNKDERVGFTHKNSRTKKDRVILLTGEARAIVEDLVQLYPDGGPLFRTHSVKRTGEHKGQRWGWSEENFRTAIWDLRRKCGLPHFSAMSYRHTYATRWLLSGRSAALLAEILGTSIKMIERHYSGVSSNQQELAKLVADFRAER